MELRKLKTADGTVVYYWGRLMHNWEGPAYIPQGNKKLAEYYVYGIKYTKEQWEEFKNDWEGLPFYKTAAGKAMGVRA
jgi:hypothetical protein